MGGVKYSFDTSLLLLGLGENTLQLQVSIFHIVLQKSSSRFDIIEGRTSTFFIKMMDNQFYCCNKKAFYHQLNAISATLGVDLYRFVICFQTFLKQIFEYDDWSNVKSR